GRVNPPRTRAMSFATEGFSAMMSFLLIRCFTATYAGIDHATRFAFTECEEGRMRAPIEAQHDKCFSGRDARKRSAGPCKASIDFEKGRPAPRADQCI